ncbi:metallophosphoesterase [Aquimarina sp. 2304DJ70-9]|uniref:metallophosphoesterase n=1 Tax=Aquimarina penaris TaxID=3231044 RepID=UPI0034627D71
MRTILGCTFTLMTLLFFQKMSSQESLPNKQVSHIFYAIGDVGEAIDFKIAKQNFNALKEILKQAPKNSTLLFLGNNFSKNSFSKIVVPNKRNTSGQINSMANIINTFNGNSIFIPGNTDWDFGPKGLKKQENLIEKVLGESAFQPENGCPIKRIKVNSEIDLIILDSQWAIMNWDKYPTLNNDCDIKTKEDFYEQVENKIKKGEGKTVILAAHHPVKSMGSYGDRFSFGLNPQNLSNRHYKEFSDRIITIAKQTEKVILLSGHDNSLQYLKEKGIPIIISGSGSRGSRVSNVKKGFTASDIGFSKLTQFVDGAVWVSFYGNSNGYVGSLYNAEILPPNVYYEDAKYHKQIVPQYVWESIYTKDELKNGRLYKALLGNHYREDYTTKVKLKTVLLDTLYGGLTPLRMGGGHQTNSIRLTDRNGREYTMRSAKKSALRFLQYFLFKTQYLEADVADTFFIELLQDYWTTANPYGVLTIADLADAIGVLHPNPRLFYVPKQKALGKYNDSFGNKIYFIEERLADGHKNARSLGNSNEIVNTAELLEKLRSKEDFFIDEQLYIRARIFDNLIGDWDRHADQWKWAKTKTSVGETIYLPIPRDRDQAFSDFDGAFLRLLTSLNPPLRFMQRYNGDYNYSRWFNDAGDDIDFAVLKNHTRTDWIKQARFIKANLTEDVIEKAFENLPKEIDQKRMASVKSALKKRLGNIEINATEVYEYLARHIFITGTDKEDYFEIIRMPNGKTKVKGYKNANAEDRLKFWDATYNSEDTHEIWIYGLNDSDTFRVSGKGNNKIHIKIIGGNGKDTYRIENKRNIKVYDQKSKKNTFEKPVSKFLSDKYDLNTYYFKNNRKNISSFKPLLAYEPDDGLGIGLQFNHQKNSLVRNPFTDDHRFEFAYYPSTTSVNIKYQGEFASIFDKINLAVELNYSSPNYTDNFFGFGNGTQNFDDDFGSDFNRVRIQKSLIAPSLVYRGFQGSIISTGISYENFEVERTNKRFIDTAPLNQNIFDIQHFIGVHGSFEYDNLRNIPISKAGIGFKLTGGYITSLNENRSFPYLISQARIATKLDKRERIVLASKIKTRINFNNEFEFYQGATIGGNDGLRGFREQRFTGKRSFYHSTDLRFALGKLRNKIIPIGMGTYAGFDYGRVWIENDNSNTWHTSVGGGIYFSLSGFTAFNIAYFSSDEGGRVTLGLNLPF